MPVGGPPGSCDGRHGSSTLSAMRSSPDRYVLTFTCVNHVGLVHAVAGWVVGHQGDITDSQQFDNPVNGRFFMRVEFRTEGVDVETLRGSFVAVAADHAMS